MAPGNWQKDFFAVAPVCEGIVQTVHVFLDSGGEFERAEPVGYPMSAEAYAAGMDSIN